MREFTVKQTGAIDMNKEGMFVKVSPEFIPVMQALEGFSHIKIVWWCDGCDDEASGKVLQFFSPYKGSPDSMGVFATRSPQRTNPIALTSTQVINIDHKAGTIQIAYTHTEKATPAMDVKPYTPSLDRVEKPKVPGFCSHWPKSLEESGDFDWDSVFDY